MHKWGVCKPLVVLWIVSPSLFPEHLLLRWLLHISYFTRHLFSPLNHLFSAPPLHEFTFLTLLSSYLLLHNKPPPNLGAGNNLSILLMICGSGIWERLIQVVHLGSSWTLSGQLELEGPLPRWLPHSHLCCFPVPWPLSLHGNKSLPPGPLHVAWATHIMVVSK